MIGKRLHIIIALTALCLPHIAVNGQIYPNTPVTISSEKTTMNGIQYYVHNVLERQTLYSICKTYDVTVDELDEANRELELKQNGLKMGQVLLIPVKAQMQEATPAEEAVPAVGQQPQAQVPQAQDKDYEEYVVKWYDDLGAIAAKHGMDKETLMAYNGLTSSKLSRKQTIRIPLHPEKVVIPAKSAQATADEEQPSGGEQIAGAVDSPAHETSEKIGSIFKRKGDRVSVLIVLPFNAKGTVNDSAYDLYSGMLLSARDLAESGVKTDIKVIDTKNSQTPVTGSALEDVDMVFGPIAPDDITALLGKCPSGTTVISPLDPRASSLAAEHPDLIHAPSPADAQYADMARWIKEDLRHGDKVLLVSEKGSAPTAITRYISENGIEHGTLTYAITEGRTVSFDRYMSDGGTTRVVIASEKEAFINDVVRNLNLLAHRKYNVILYAPSKIRNFETIDIESLHGVQAHIASSYFIDYDNARQKNFLMSYRALFGAEPTPFAYVGYDTFRYFVSAYDKYGRNWLDTMSDRTEQGLQSDFRLEKAGEDGGYVNQAVRRAIYDTDYSIKVIR